MTTLGPVQTPSSGLTPLPPPTRMATPRPVKTCSLWVPVSQTCQNLSTCHPFQTSSNFFNICNLYIYWQTGGRPSTERPSCTFIFEGFSIALLILLGPKTFQDEIPLQFQIFIFRPYKIQQCTTAYFKVNKEYNVQFALMEN